MEDQEVVYLESLCKHLYEPSSSEQRSEVEKAIMEFSESHNCFQRCLLLLERGTNAYAQLVASTTLCKLISKQAATVVLEDRIELHNYLLNYLVNRTKLPPFVLNSLCQLFARLTKLGWFDFTKENEYVFRNCVRDILKQVHGFLGNLAVELLSNLVAEMNQQNGLGSVSKHRKIAASFRDDQLFDIFQMCIKLLTDASENIKTLNLADENQLSLVGGLLRLAHNCLTFDFIGSVTDDTADDGVSLQVPTAWRVAFLDCSILNLFYSLYSNLPRALSSLALSCLVQLASVRRTVFNNSERQNYLAGLIRGIKNILDNPQGLTDQTNYHEFCRLLARLKSNYQLSELIRIDDYAKLIRMIADFTVQSVMMFQFSANSIHYLLSFWQRMISSMPYVKAAEPHSLDLYTPSVTKAYIESRMSLVNAVVNEGLEDPLDDHASLSQQMEQVAVFGRCEYPKTCQLLVELFDQTANSYQQACSANNRKQELVEQTRLTWLVYIIGAVIGGRVSFNPVDEHDKLDGDLICRAMQLMRVTDGRLSDRGLENLEHAYLWFLDQFRKIYISDQIQKTCKVYHKLAEVLGLNDEAMVLAVFICKIITNLKYWSQCEKLVDDTLTLLNDLSIGYSSVRKLVRLQEVQFLMKNHTSEHFSFLGTSVDVKTMKSRTTFYTALTRLLCIELGDEEEEFEQFISPLSSAFVELGKVFALPDAAIVNQIEARKAVIGMARDLRGIAFACNMKIAYLMLFDWIYPNNLGIFLRALQIWYDDPDVTTPILKLMAELCQNRSQRLQFDVSSPNATLLFKEASKTVCTYGSHVLSMASVPKEQFYRLRLKGITICFSILKAALCGGYVNFGVFRLYGDTCLEDVLTMFVKLLMLIPQSEILAYSKLSQNYYFLLECIAQDHMNFIAQLEPRVFVYILQTLHDGLTALGCCQTLDFIVSYLYRRLSRTGKLPRAHAGVPPESDNCLRTLEMHADVLRQMLATILNVLVFEECRNQWSMSRPFLGLILLNEDYFSQLKAQLINAQPVDKQAIVAQCFTTLMQGIERSLTVKSKDRFTQNLSTFKREINDCIRGVQAEVSSPSGAGFDSGGLGGGSGTAEFPRNPSYAEMMTS